MKKIFSALLLLSFFFSPLGSPFAAEPKKKASQDSYKINFKDVSLIEYVRFVSKICDTNFIYDAKELNFKVTVVSEDPTTPENVMAALIQILRVYGFSILEQGKDLVIHKSDDVKQLAHVVDSSFDPATSPPIVTTVFTLQFGKVETISAILRSMISKQAVLEISPETKQIIVTDIGTNILKIAQLLEKIEFPEVQLNIQTYIPKNKSVPTLIDIASKLLSPYTQNAHFFMIPDEEENSIVITSSQQLVDRAVALLQKIDTQTVSKNIFMYKPQKNSLKQLDIGLKNLADSLESSGFANKKLLETLRTPTHLKEADTLIFHCSKENLPQLQEFLENLDSLSKSKEAANQENFFIYQIEHVSKESLDNYLKNIAQNLKESDQERSLRNSIETRKWLSDSNSFMFSGPNNTLLKIKELIAKLDLPEDKQPPTKESFFIYQLKNQSKERLLSYLNTISSNLKPSQADLKDAIGNVKWISDSNSLFFSGKEKALSQLKELLANKELFVAHKESFFTFHSKKHTKDQVDNFLKGLLLNLQNVKGEEDLKLTIDSMKWVSDSSSYIFSGKESTLAKLKEILNQFDLAKAEASSTYLLYKLKYMSGSIIQEDLDNFADSIKNKKLGKQSLIEVIDNIKWIKETNSLLLTGDARAVAETQELIAKYDIPRTGKSKQKDNFFIYKPLQVEPLRFEKAIKSIRENLEKAELADPNLINALSSVKYVEANSSFVFTGSKDSLDKIKELLPTIDTVSKETAKAAIQRLGQTSFLVFKVRGDPLVLQNSVKSLSADLAKSKNTADESFAGALNSMKYVKETHSLLFTGPDLALEKVQSFLESLQGIAPPPVKGQGAFYIYKPLHLSGPALETILQDFSDHLKTTGFDGEELYRTINSAKWVEKTNSMIFTGSKKSIDELKGLLVSFDTSDKAAPISAEAPIQPIDNLSFLVYKLQYHKGSEIQTALKQIAKNLIAQNAKVEQGLLNTIDSIQWIEITNSLLCSGPQETVERLKDLIRNLDMPLKQVFIEVLIIETELGNLLSFGLDWGSKFKYRNKLAGSVSNMPNPTGTFPPTGSNNFPNTFNQVDATHTPIPATGLPFEKGFDFGVIGDIIMHKGKSFLSLGSLVNALQDDHETAVIMTPKIIAQDGKTSKIFSGTNVPYIGGQTANTGGASSMLTTTYEYRDIGLDLTITPVLGNSDTITLAIDLEKTVRLSGDSSALGIATSKTNMSTTVHMPDKKFLILSGLVQESKERVKTGLPCLGGIPMIGAAFATNTKNDDTKSLVIFIRPHIINSYKDMTSVTENQEDFFREYTGSPGLERDYDESIEILKTYEDEE